MSKSANQALHTSKAVHTQSQNKTSIYFPALTLDPVAENNKLVFGIGTRQAGRHICRHAHTRQYLYSAPAGHPALQLLSCPDSQIFL